MLRQKPDGHLLQPMTTEQLPHQMILIQHRQGIPGGHGVKTQVIIDRLRLLLLEQDVMLCIELRSTDRQKQSA